DPDSSARDVAAVVAEDPAMTARVLRMVNSAFYGLPETVTSVRQAIFILGISAVQSLLQCAGVVEMFSGADAHRDFQEKFWRHSMAAASAARVLCTGTRGDSRSAAGIITCPEEAFTAGLLHDIGKMVLFCYLPGEQAQVAGHPMFGKTPDSTVEREVLGIDHARIGAELARRWQLPPALVGAVAHHHDLDVEDPGTVLLSRIAHAADYLAHVVGIEPQAETVLPPIAWRQMAVFGFEESNLPEFADLVRKEYGRAQIFMTMIRG
ncbi:MAG TPA: HDOD domain-containing protein, partial [Acidobacteriota bacterium]|nr:HDOD domain-containing protein [Acidobacteriota bacterium]